MLLKELFTFLPKSKKSASSGLLEGKYPFFTSSNTIDKYINIPDYNGEFLIIGDGGTGNCKFYKGCFSVSDHNYVLQPKSGTNALCVQYFLKRDNYKILNDGFKGVGIKNVSKTYIENINYSYNKKITEKVIVSNLINIELLIEKCKKQLFLFNELIKSRFIEMFGNPIDNPHNFELNYLSNLGYLSRGKSKHRPRNDPKLLGGTYPLIQTGDVKQADLYISHYESTYSEFGLNQSKLWPKGTLCITIAANIAETTILKFDACFPDSVVGFIANEKVNTIFIRYQIEALKEFLNSKATEVAQKNLNIEKLESVQFMTPEINLQNEFASFVEQVDKLKFVIHSRYFLCEILTLFSSTIAYSRVVSILACPNIFCTCSIGIPLSMAFVANVLLNL